MFIKDGTTSIVGIDFGTTNSVVSYYDTTHDNIKQLAFGENNEGIYPSVINFEKYGRNEIVFAQPLLQANALEKTIFESKRLLGLQLCDLENEGNETVLHTLCEDNNGNCCYKIEMEEVEDLQFTVPQAVGIQLGFLREIISKKFPKKVPFHRTIIAYPPSFSEQQIELLKYSYTIAGFTVIKMISEPEAAFKYFQYLVKNSNFQMPKTILVIDIGGGTTDACICEYNSNGKCEIKKATGNSMFGGKEFDELMMMLIIEKFEEAGYSRDHFIIDGNDNEERKKLKLKIIRNLKIEAEKIKRELSEKNNKEYSLNELLEKCNILEMNDINIIISKEDYENKIRNERIKQKTLQQHIEDVIDKCIRINNKTKQDINGILFVGGATKMPIVERIVKEYLPNTQILSHEDFDRIECVSRGITLFSHELEVQERTSILQKMPFSIQCRGIQTVIKKDTPFPINKEITRKIFHNSPKMNLELRVGESPCIEENSFIGTLEVRCPQQNVEGYKVLHIQCIVSTTGEMTLKAWIKGYVQGKTEIIVELFDDSLTNNEENDKFFIEQYYFNQIRAN